MSSNSFFKVWWSFFIKGLLYTVPLAILFYVIYSLFIFFDSLIPTRLPGLGLIILIAFISLMGWLGSTIIGKPIITYFNKLLNRVPLIKTIYTAVTDLLSAFVGQKKRFNKPVLVRMTRNSDLEKLGFITTENMEALHIGPGKVAVYLPHSFNFSGNLYIVPRENVTLIDHNTAEVMKFIVSGGVTAID